MAGDKARRLLSQPLRLPDACSVLLPLVLVAVAVSCFRMSDCSHRKLSGNLFRASTDSLTTSVQQDHPRSNNVAPAVARAVSPISIAPQAHAATASQPTQAVHASSRHTVYTNAIHTPARKYHIITTQGDGIYVEWQMRIHYYWYRKIKAKCEMTLGQACEMGGFTRILHSGQPDDLMDEIPTFVAQPVPGMEDAIAAYAPLNRPWAIMQWVQQANIAEDFVLICEADIMFIKPLPNMMGDAMRLVAPKIYFLKPSTQANMPLVAQFLPKKNMTAAQAAKIPTSGNSPVFCTKEQLRRLAPLWHQMNIDIYNNPSTKAPWHWIREMYAFVIGIYRAGLGDVDMPHHLVALPPYDLNALGMLSPEGKSYYTVHYSYSFDYQPNGTFTPKARGAWHFHKRDYQHRPPPRNLPAPPSYVKNDMIRTVVNMLNEATSSIPCWDEYVKTKRKPAVCKELPGARAPNSNNTIAL